MGATMYFGITDDRLLEANGNKWEPYQTAMLKLG
jgi:hypothetical protein